MAPAEVTIAILAGGKATRLPGKLERKIGGEPLLAKVYRNLRGAAPIVIAAAATFEPELDAVLDCPLVVDRSPGRGPLEGLLSACSEIATPLVFAVAGDAPRVTPPVLDALLAARRDGDEAVVPRHGGHLEPLAAVYDRRAVEREGPAVLNDGNASMHELLARLRVRHVEMAADFFLNVNTAVDLDKV